MIYDEVIRRIEKGIVGGNQGIPTGFNKLSEYIPGLQKGTYYLLGEQ